MAHARRRASARGFPKVCVYKDTMRSRPAMAKNAEASGTLAEIRRSRVSYVDFGLCRSTIKYEVIPRRLKRELRNICA
jgi:hypothetical protein